MAPRFALLLAVAIHTAFAQNPDTIRAAAIAGCYHASPAFTYSAFGGPEHGDTAWAIVQLAAGGRARRPLLRSNSMDISHWRMTGDTLDLVLSDGLVGWHAKLLDSAGTWRGKATYLTDAMGAPPVVHDMTLEARPCGAASLGFGAVPVPSVSSETRSDEELNIIAAAIDSLYVRGDPTRGGVVIASPTAAVAVDVARKQLEEVPADAVQRVDFVRRNLASLDLQPLSKLAPAALALAFLTADAPPLPRDNPDVFWQAFYARFPGAGGLITVSRPAIDATGTRAVLLIGRGCGGLCGNWGYATLRKDGDRWRVERYVSTRVS